MPRGQEEQEVRSGRELLGPRGTGSTKEKQVAQLWEGCRARNASHASLLEKPLSAWQTLTANTDLPAAESNLSQPRLGYSGGRGKRHLLCAGFASGSPVSGKRKAHESFKEPAGSSGQDFWLKSSVPGALAAGTSALLTGG